MPTCTCHARQNARQPMLELWLVHADSDRTLAHVGADRASPALKACAERNRHLLQVADEMFAIVATTGEILEQGRFASTKDPSLVWSAFACS